MSEANKTLYLEMDQQSLHPVNNGGGRAENLR